MLNQNQALIQAYDNSIISRTERRVAGFNRTHGVVLGMQPNELRKGFVEETSSPMTYDYINLVGHSKAICAKNNGIIKKDELYMSMSTKFKKWLAIVIL